MRWGRWQQGHQVGWGIWGPDGVHPVPLARLQERLPAEAWLALERADIAAWVAAGGASYEALLYEVALEEPAVGLDEIRWLAPVVRPPKNVLCIGRNYRPHALEAARFRGQVQELPRYPMIFTKPPTAITDPEAPIWYDPQWTEQLDYEGELAVIIGAAGRDIPERHAMRYVYGYTLMNDVTARDLQARHQQYFKGKGLDSYAPLGPVVLTATDVSDPEALEVRTYVNGELRQADHLGNLIFSIPHLIAVLSRGMTLEPGDIISTGTPAGVGIGFDPPRFLQPGDVVEVVVSEIGRLRNPVRWRDA